MRISRITTATVACAMAASAVTFADTRIEFKTTEGQGGSFQSFLIGQGKVRSDADKNTSVIFDPTAGSMTMLDHSKKTFTRMTKADIDQMAKMAEDMMKQMEQAMASVPPEMREKMKGMMGGAMGPAIDVVDTGKSATVGGRSCRIFQSNVLGKPAGETCMAEPSALEIAAADRATLTAAIAWFKELADKMAKGPLARMGNATPFRGGMIPLRSTTFGSDGSKNTSEFTGVSTAAIPAEMFAVPAGYKEQKIELPKGRGDVR